MCFVFFILPPGKLRSEYRQQVKIQDIFIYSCICLSMSQKHCKGQKVYFHLLLVLVSSMIFLLALCLLLFLLQVFSSTLIFKRKPTWFPFGILKTCGVNRTHLLQSILLPVYTLRWQNSGMSHFSGAKWKNLLF